MRRAVQERIERLLQGRFERLLAEAYLLSNEYPATDLLPTWIGPLPAARRAGPPTTGSRACLVIVNVSTRNRGRSAMSSFVTACYRIRISMLLRAQQLATTNATACCCEHNSMLLRA